MAGPLSAEVPLYLHLLVSAGVRKYPLLLLASTHLSSYFIYLNHQHHTLYPNFSLYDYYNITKDKNKTTL